MDRKMASWSTRAGYIGLLGFFVMAIGYMWHDGTWAAYYNEVDESECSMVRAAPIFYSSSYIDACNQFMISGIMVVLGWIMFICGAIGYFILPDKEKRTKSAAQKSKPKAEAKPESKPLSKEPKTGDRGPKTAKPAERVVLLCPKCGAKNDEDAEFCKKCGKRLRPKNRKP